MTYLIDVPVEGGGQLLVEATEVDLPADLVLAARPGEVLARAGQTLEQALDQLRPAVQAVRNGLAAMAPDEVTVEFGIKLGAETGIVVAKGSTEVHFTVTLCWKRPDPPAPDTTSAAGPAESAVAGAPAVSDDHARR